MPIPMHEIIVLLPIIIFKQLGGIKLTDIIKRKTQQEQIKEAERAYIMPLNPSAAGNIQRYSVYLDSGNGLTTLWPSDCQERSNSKELLPGQIFFTGDFKHPGFHFRYEGYNYNRIDDIRQELQKINKDIKVFLINGGSPLLKS